MPIGAPGGGTKHPYGVPEASRFARQASNSPALAGMGSTPDSTAGVQVEVAAWWPAAPAPACRGALQRSGASAEKTLAERGVLFPQAQRLWRTAWRVM